MIRHAPHTPAPRRGAEINIQANSRRHLSFQRLLNLLRRLLSQCAGSAVRTRLGAMRAGDIGEGHGLEYLPQVRPIRAIDGLMLPVLPALPLRVPIGHEMPGQVQTSPDAPPGQHGYE